MTVRQQPDLVEIEDREEIETRDLLQDIQTYLRGYPNYLWFCSVRLSDTDYFSFTVYAPDSRKALERVKKALKKFGLVYMDIGRPYRQRTHWRKVGS